MKTTFLILTFSFLIILTKTQAQNIDNWVEANEKVPLEKIYAQTDAEYYFQNDTLWFKIYLLDSNSGQLIPRAENIYIRLIDKNGNSVVQSILLSVNGQASGSLTIPGTLYPDNYLLQAYTDYLLNFNDKAWFQKVVNVSRIPLTSRTTSNQAKKSGLIENVTFYPQGENLLENVTNMIAFKAINKAGSGIDARGTVVDERGKTVATFKTDFKGMGLFFLTPEPGKTYTAKISGLQNFRHNFIPVKEGIKIQLVNHTSNEIILNIAGNAEKFVDKSFFLVNMHKGKVLFYHPFKMEGINQVLKFDSQILKEGINRFVLLDEELNPVSERLLFSQNIEINQLHVSTQSAVFSNREKIEINIKNDERIETTEVANLSLSVINKDALAGFGRSRNIVTHLLVDSELSDFYDNSAEFFTNETISSEAKLRLLMLCSGWGSYLWNSIPGKNTPLNFEQTAGLNIEGLAKNNLTEKPLENAEITMVIQKDKEIAFLNQTTDENGVYTFPGLLFNDSAKVNIQAKNEKGNMNTSISVFQPFKTTQTEILALKTLNENPFSPPALKLLKYQSNAGNKKTRKPVLKRKTKKEDEKETLLRSSRDFRLYENADFVLQINENEESYENVIDYMIGKVPGVDINGNNVRIRGTSSFGNSSSPLFLVDGIPMGFNSSLNLPENITSFNDAEEENNNTSDLIIQSVKSIPLNDVDKIEVLKSPQNLAIFGVNGANGVIAIYTRQGNPGNTNKLAKGVLEQKIMGYSTYKKFNSPNYSVENDAEKIADFRTTLFWEPGIITENGNAGVSFFTSDQKGKYVVYVEGITDNGKICLGTAEFEVK